MKPYQRKVGYLIAGAVFFKLLLAAVLQLGNDEVYYLTYAQKLQWNYFDHPPLIALVIKCFSANLLLDFTGWKVFARRFDAICREDMARGIMKPPAFILSDYWFPAAHMNWYLSEKYGYPFMAVGPLTDIHQFAWLNRQRPGLRVGADAYYIAVSNYYRKPVAGLTRCFAAVGETQAIPQIRMGRVVRYFYITRLWYYKGGIGPAGITG